MSILIKGLKMPEDGALLCIKIYPSGVVRTCFSPHLPPDSKIATAIPVSDHGDLIERDALLDSSPVFVTASFGVSEEFISRYKVITAPVVIPAERSDDGDIT